MRQKLLIYFSALSLLVASAMPGRLAAQEESATQKQNPEVVRYAVRDLGTFGGPLSLALGMNNAGEVTGQAATADQTDGFAATAFLWTKRKGMTNLGVLGPPAFPDCPTCNSGAAGVSGLGQVAMGSEIATLDPNGQDFGQWDPLFPTHRVTRAVIWRNGVMKVLPNLPGGNNANPFWINSLGQVSGVAESDNEDPSCAIGPNGPSEPWFNQPREGNQKQAKGIQCLEHCACTTWPFQQAWRTPGGH